MEFPRAVKNEDPPDDSADEVRAFRDVGGRVWHIYAVIERTKYGVALEKVRHNWLCFESDGERRFISPIPETWRSWTDQECRLAMLHARPDLRR